MYNLLFFFLFYFNYFMFNFMFNTGESMYYNHLGPLGLDIFSKNLILICFIIFIISYLSMSDVMNFEGKMIFFTLFLFSFLLFYSLNLLLFFILLEGVLFPMIYFFFYFGEYKKRHISLSYMFLMTLIFGVPLFIFILIGLNKGMDMYIKYNNLFINSFFFLMIILGFLMKLPVYGFHYWLPKAHVDAPVGGSMILAGIMLKYGGYGLIRSIFILEFMTLSYYFFLTVFFLGGMGYMMMSFICVKILDIKVLIAFSSVSHMSFAMIGNLNNMYMGLKGSYYMYIGHGLISPLMFYLAYMMYKMYHTRLIIGINGIGKNNNFKNLILLIFLMNLGFPPFMNFISEIFIFSSSYCFLFLLLFFFFFGFIFNGLYTIKLLTMIFNKYNMFYVNSNISFINYITIFISLLFFFLLSGLLFIMF
nr:NADH dehydrogenase subunit 4 [Didemnum perlucidum]